jgi:hypothetical protein
VLVRDRPTVEDRAGGETPRVAEDRETVPPPLRVVEREAELVPPLRVVEGADRTVLPLTEGGRTLEVPEAPPELPPLRTEAEVLPPRAGEDAVPPPPFLTRLEGRVGSLEGAGEVVLDVAPLPVVGCRSRTGRLAVGGGGSKTDRT